MKLILIFTLFFLSCNSFGKLHEIRMLNKGENVSMVFEPSFLKINPGDQIKFIPIDKGHNTQSVFTPKEGETWISKNNEEIVITLNKEGFYVYKCKNHVVMGMFGLIQVGNPINSSETKAFLKDFSSQISINKHRIEEAIARIK